jgi:aminoglycoside phosphotransferase (APT) family kinase protein
MTVAEDASWSRNNGAQYTGDVRINNNLHTPGSMCEVSVLNLNMKQRIMGLGDPLTEINSMKTVVRAVIVCEHCWVAFRSQAFFTDHQFPDRLF